MLSPADAELARRDTAIPGMALLLDPETFLAALRAVLPGVGLDTARATYVRYKPGMNCLVAYTLRVGGVDIAAYAKAHRLDARDQLQKARDKPGVAGPLGPGRIVLDGKAIFVSVFPNDSELKSLDRLADNNAWPRLLCRVFSKRPELAEGSVRSIRYKPERRYVTQLLINDGPQAVMKMYTETGYPEARNSARVFRSRDVLQVPRTLGSSNRHHVLAFEWMQGQLLSDMLATQNVDLAAMEKVGAALAEVHGHNPLKLPRLTREAEASNLLSVSAGLEFLCSHLAGRINSLARRLAGHLLHEPPLNLPVHGDFYAKQVLLAGAKVVILDFDAAAAGDPAYDLGLFIAHLERGALRGTVPSGLVEPVGDALLRGYEAVSKRPVRDRVALYSAAGLLRLAPHPFRNRHSNWPQDIETTVARAEAILQAARYKVPLTNSSHNGRNGDVRDEREAGAISIVSDPFNVASDPAMPFLAQALNPLDVHLQFRRRLAHLAGDGGHLDVLAIRVVRHKRGRRCLIEYDIAVERPGQAPEVMTLVGKARARGLDRSTYETLVSLWKAGFREDSEDGISVPQPAGIVPEFQMWLHRKVQGVPATQLLPAPDGSLLAQRIAKAAHKLHTARMRPQRRHSMADELRILHEKLPIVAQTRPEWAGRIVRLMEACNRLGAGLAKPPRRTGVHRDFYADQIVVDGSRLYLLDFDLYCEGDPSLDIGNFLGHMEEWSLRTHGDIGALTDRERALEERFVELSGEAVRPSVRAYTLLTLTRHVYLSTQYPDRKQFTERLLEICELRFAEALDESRLSPVHSMR
ncbi:MAG TPA: phosphotransferase [Chloroflexia bacterium]|nr:phosphotransferase [Chloroflexia bacterium]